jgi:hypothetical protein
MNRYKTVYVVVEDGPGENKIKGIFEKEKDAEEWKEDCEKTVKEMKVTYLDYRIEKHSLIA